MRGRRINTKVASAVLQDHRARHSSPTPVISESERPKLCWLASLVHGMPDLHPSFSFVLVSCLCPL